MKRFTKKILVFILAFMLTVPMLTVGVSAASTVSVTGGDEVTGGEVFTVTVTFDGESIGRVIGDITYDTEMLAYISGGSSSGNVGYVELKQAGTGEALVFNLTFQALTEGTTQLNVSASELYDLNEGYMETPSTVKTVVISGTAEEEEIIEETTVPDEDASDEGLSVDEKDESIEPEFDTAETTESIESDNISDTETEIGSDADNSGLLAKAIMVGIGMLVLILIIVMILKRKK